MSKITSIKARQILDSRGNPTIEAEVYTSSGKMGRASVPSGASTGSREALELRDNDPSIYGGKSVHKAIANIHEKIAPKLIGSEVTNQKNIDQTMIELDGTPFKSNLGANSILAVSLASARAGAVEEQMNLYKYLFEKCGAPNLEKRYTLPNPLMNIINGGSHASNNLDIQEFMIIPHMKKSFGENLRAGVEIFHTLKGVLKKQGYSTNVGDEGGFAPNLESHKQAIELILESITKAGLKPGIDVSLALDVAASEFYENGHYKMDGKEFSSFQMIEYLSDMAKLYPIYSIEDGLAEADFEGWTQMTKALGNNVVIVGDDLFVTNKSIFEEGIKKGQANAILIKVNQIGSLTETFETINMAFKNNYKAIISHRSGETSDHFIADLAVACGCNHIKTGSASRSDRLAKYNQLLRIEEDLGNQSLYLPIK